MVLVILDLSQKALCISELIGKNCLGSILKPACEWLKNLFCIGQTLLAKQDKQFQTHLHQIGSTTQTTVI